MRLLLLVLLVGCVDFDRDGWSVPADCDDANPGIHPGAEELCDAAEVDEDCDRRVNDDDDIALAVRFVDADGDGEGDPATAHLAESCEATVGLVDNGADCDDDDSLVRVGADEVCDGRDNDCDGRIDDADDVMEADSLTAYYPDVDGDGYGAESGEVSRCLPVANFVESSNDCNDLASEISPGAAEVCGNGVDDNCDGGNDPCGLHGDLSEGAVRFDVDDSIGVETVASVGDLDGDGWPDLALGAAALDAVYLWYGPVGGTTQFDRAEAWRQLGGVGTGLGTTLLGGRDFTGDGVVDLVVGAPDDGAVGEQAGVVWVYAGPIGAGTRDPTAVRLLGPSPGVRAGVATGWAGDVDGDGAEDLLVGASESPVEGERRGSAYLVRGPLDADQDLAWADGIYLGSGPADRLGGAVAGAGDVDGDGLDDVLIGAPGDFGGQAHGTVFLLLGPAEQTVEDADLRLVAFAPETFYGRSLAGADLNGDGYSDPVVAEPNAAPLGVVYVYDGAVWPTAFDDARAVVVAGPPAPAAGRSAVILGDCNGDGRPDLAVGAPTSSGSGLVAVYYGPVEGSRTSGTADGLFSGGSTVGSEVGAAGDFDLNGLADLYSFEPTQAAQGGEDRVWISYASGR